jgi:hypothetical protein
MPENQVEQICCRLKTENGSPCRHNRLINNPFNIYLCIQHLKCMAKDHIQNYYLHHLNDNLQTQYLTISNYMRERILNSDDETIPLYTNTNICLIEHQVLMDNTTFYRIQIPQLNVTFDIRKRVRRVSQILSRNLVPISDQFIEFFNSIVISNELSPQQILSTLSERQQSINSNVTRNSRTNRNQKYTLLDIKECFICSYNSNETEEIVRKGIKLPCCDNLNEICVECIINQLLTEHLKYNNITTINNTNFMNKEIDCPYCRNKNCYKSLLKEQSIKSTIKNMLREKLTEYYNSNIEQQLLLIN